MKKLILLFVLLSASSLIAQWVPTNVPVGGTVRSLNVSNSNIFAGTENNGIYLSSNNGVNWTESGMQGSYITSLTAYGTNIFASTSSGVYRSTNNGANWSAIGLSGKNVRALVFSGANLFAGTYQSGIYLSTNNGANWTAVGLTERDIWCFAVSGTNIIAGTYNNGGGVFMSTNNGTNWNAIGLDGFAIWSLAVSGTNIYAGSSGGRIFMTTNNGINWTSIGIENQSLNINSIVISGNTVFVAAGDYGSSHNSGVYLSTNAGANWINKSQGFDYPPPSVHSLLINNNFVYAGLFSNTTGSVWRRPLSEILGVRYVSSEIPSSFSLSQNYPNPFNQSTIVNLQCSIKGMVILKVYDITGREVQTLVNEVMNPGTYVIRFDGSGLTSGVYFYRMQAGDYIQTRRMVILK
jgi:hypothetical protein